MEDKRKKVLDTLDRLAIQYEIVEHGPALTTEDADKYIEGKEGVRTKTMFMSDKKKKRFYLFVLDGAKRLDIKSVGEMIGEKNMRIGSEENLLEKTGLIPGSVSIFGLINNEEKDIKVYLDKDMLEERLITFHPNENTATLFISMDDMFKFLDDSGHNYEIIEL